MKLFEYVDGNFNTLEIHRENNYMRVISYSDYEFLGDRTIFRFNLDVPEDLEKMKELSKLFESLSHNETI